jgi:hypothetical protein
MSIKPAERSRSLTNSNYPPQKSPVKPGSIN